MLNYYASIDLQNKVINVLDLVQCRNLAGVEDLSAMADEVEKAIKDKNLLIYNLNNTSCSIVDGISNSKGETFKNVFECADYAIDKGLSSASKNRIISTINRNLSGATKTAYGLSWKYNLIELDEEVLKDFKVNTDALYM